MDSETHSGDGANGIKLRNSCDACAAAKIKCTQEKPTCAYCARRLKACVYSANKRVRRQTHKPSKDSTTAAAATRLSPISQTSESNKTSSSTALLGQDWPDLFTALMSPGTTISPLAEPFTSAEWANLGASADSYIYVDDSTLDFSIPQASLDQENPTNINKVVSNTIFKAGTFASTNNNSINSSTRGNGGLTEEPPNVLIDTQTDATFATSSSSGNSPHVSMDPSEAWIGSQNDDTSIRQPNLEQVHNQIENMSVEIGKVLECSCSKNSYLLILLSLVIFRIQAWYAAAVNAATSDDKESKTLDGAGANPARPGFVLPSSWSDLDGDESQREDKRRIFIQCILSRLTGLQILISRLSQCIANVEAESISGVTLTSAAQGSPYPTAEGEISVMPFSPSPLHALLSDLRGSLRRLSRAVVERL